MPRLPVPRGHCPVPAPLFHAATVLSAAYAAVFGIGAAGADAAAPVLFADDFEVDSAASYAVAATPDVAHAFAFDYGVHGIPPAPEAATTRGLKLQAHLANTLEVHAITLSTNATFAANPGYRLRFHAWQNFGLGQAGSTNYLTAGAGHDGATVNFSGNSGPTGPTPDKGAGAWFAVTGDNGAANDYIAFKDGVGQTPLLVPSPYSAPHSGSFPAQSGNIPYYTAQFPPINVGAINGGAVGAAQGQSGVTVAGTVGFAWRLWEVDVNGPVVSWSIDGLPIARLESGVNGTMATDGRVSLGYMDPFNSASGRPGLQFAIVDNLTVTELPEPTALAAAASTIGLSLAGRRRRGPRIAGR